MEPTTDGHEKSGRGKRAGLALAGVLALAVIGLVVWSVIFRAPAPQGPGPVLQSSPVLGDPGQVAALPEAAGIQDLIQSAEEAELQFFNPEDESLRGLMTFARLDPQPNGRFFAETPEAWLLLSNGMTAEIKAREANFVMPAGAGEPESGRFAGDVRLGLHRGRLATAEARAASTPVVSLQMDELNFDAALGQLRTTSTVNVRSADVEGQFEGLEVVIDEPGRKLSHLSTRGGGWMAQTPDAEADPAAAGGPAGQDQPANPAGAQHREDFYTARLDGSVEITSGARTLRADQLEIWARLLDGALPEGALAGFIAAPGSGDEQSTDSADAPAVTGTTLRWGGRLVIEPKTEKPAELADGALVGRFSSPASGLVLVEDHEAESVLRCARATYEATTRRLTLAGSGSTGVSFEVAGVGQATCGRLEVDLTTGVALMPGPGELRALARPGDDRRLDRVIAWQRRAQLELETIGGQADLSGAWPLRVATFEGVVSAHEGEAEVTGDTISARFARTADGGPELTRVVVTGNGRATAPEQGRLLGERLTVDFQTRDGELSPTTILAEGRAMAQRGAESIEASILSANLGRDPSTGELRMEDLEAQLGVRVVGKGGEEALADSLTADPLRGVYDLVGEPVTLRRGGASVTGGSMRIEEIEERLTVFGKGELAYQETRDSARGYQRVTVGWTGTMTFNGVLERTEFVGDCVVVASADEFTRDTLRGERIIVEVDLDGSDEPAGSSESPVSAFRRAQIIGEIEELGRGRTAQIESRRYRRDPGSESGRALEFLAYLDGPTLIADAATDTLLAPASGRLLFEDRRAGSGGPRDGLDTKGTTLFEWEGAARFDRGDGEAIMTRNVRLRQKSPGSDVVTELECERLDAVFALPDGRDDGEDSGALRAKLKLARASGAVYAQQGTRELIADRLEFDADAGVAQAWANAGNLVTIYDSVRPIPLTGSVLRWDLIRDRIEWRDAGTTTAPR